MAVSNQPFESRAICKSIKFDENFQNIKSLIRKSSKAELSEKCPTTNANLIFQCVQRKNDAEALQLCQLLCDELLVCDPLHLDVNKQSAIFFAARDGNVLCLEFLLKKGCTPNQKDSALQTALFYAARDGRLEAIALLLSYGADINTVDHLGQTALFYAARDGRVKVVFTMIEMGADINIKDCSRRTALYYAQKSNSKEIIALLKAATEQQSKKEISDDAAVNKISKTVDNSSKTNNASQPVTRNLYQLCIKSPLTDVNAVQWLTSTPELIEIFEMISPNIAVWSKSATSPVKSIYYDLRKKWHPIAIKLLDELVKLEGGWMFSKPVDCKAWGCPDYYHVILTPMDFTTMRRKIRNNNYERCVEFLDDMQLIFSNCFQYNRPESHVALIARDIEAACKKLDLYSVLMQWVDWEKDVEQWYNQFLQTYAVKNEGRATNPE